MRTWIFSSPYLSYKVKKPHINSPISLTIIIIIITTVVVVLKFK